MNAGKTVEGSLDERYSRSALLVLGMHRSGTSAITGALRLCGAWVGEETELTGANAENPHGFWERRDMRQICDRLLHTAGADWWKVANFDPDAIPHAILVEQRQRFAKIIAALDEHETWIVKEPRLCLLLPVIRDYITDPVCIHIVRNPLEVARSLQARNGFGIAAGLALWEAYNRRASSASENIPRVLVSHESLMLYPVETLGGLVERLDELAVSNLVSPDEGRLKQFINPSLYRRRATEEETEEHLSPSQRALWLQFCNDQIGETGGSAAVPRVTRQHLFDLESTELSLNYHKDRARELSAELGKRDATIRGMKRRVGELSTESRKRAATIQARDATIQGLLESTSWKITTPLRSLSRGVRWFWRKFRRALKLLFWLITGQFSRAVKVLLPYYRRYVPRYVHELVPKKLRAFAAWHVIYPDKPVLTPFRRPQATATPPTSTYIVRSTWWERHPDAARSLAQSGQAVIVMGCSSIATGANVTAVAGIQARTLALAAVATGTAIEIEVDAEPAATAWSKWSKAVENGEARRARGVCLLTLGELRRELASAVGRETA